ncbi:MAG: hypothetical protein Kilf2KO_18370 [Rhodospirillales bacterium]
MDEEERSAPARWGLGRDLEPLGVEELEAYARALTNELDRVRAASSGKKAYLGDAAKLFKT